VALLPLCAIGVGGGARGCVRLVVVFDVLCCVCCTVGCVRRCRVQGRSWASRGVLCLCVRARQIPVLGWQQDQWQFPQCGVRTVVAEVSGCVPCVRTASWHWVYWFTAVCSWSALAALMPLCAMRVGGSARGCVRLVWCVFV
jgi:hypothetical protein